MSLIANKASLLQMRACQTTRTHILHPQRLRSSQIAIQKIMTAPTRPWEQYDSATRRRVRSHLIRAAVGPDGRERDLCDSPDGTARFGRNQRKPLARIVTFARAERSPSKRRARNSSRYAVSQTPPVRVKAPSNLVQTQPPPPQNTVEKVAAQNETQVRCSYNAAPSTPQGSSSNHHDFLMCTHGKLFRVETPVSLLKQGLDQRCAHKR